MKIYWGSRDIPELTGLSRLERFKAIQTCFWKFGFRDRQCWAALLGFIALVVLGVVVGITSQYMFHLPVVIYLACYLITGEIGVILYRSVLIDRLRPHLRDYVEKRKT